MMKFTSKSNIHCKGAPKGVLWAKQHHARECLWRSLCEESALGRRSKLINVNMSLLHRL
jgi:hypothetical protein